MGSSAAYGQMDRLALVCASRATDAGLTCRGPDQWSITVFLVAFEIKSLKINELHCISRIYFMLKHGVTAIFEGFPYGYVYSNS